jgi:hypothetical protein
VHTVTLAKIRRLGVGATQLFGPGLSLRVVDRLSRFDGWFVLSTIDISPAHSIAAGVEFHVMKCSESN